MASYKVPQDVEADDKLLGPFTFRQFVYLMIVFGMIVLAVALFQVFPLLAIIPVPIAIFFIILALPIKKDQPMETYLAALVSFYLKPRKRVWIPGQSDSTIQITAPKHAEPIRARNITGDEASHRLSFLAELVDSEGRAIKNANTTMKDDFYAEAMGTTDMFDRGNNYGTNNATIQEESERRAAVVNQMREAIQASEAEHASNQQITPNTNPVHGERVIQPRQGFVGDSSTPQSAPEFESPTVIQPLNTPATGRTINPHPNPPVNRAKENTDEVFISLH